MMSSPFDRDKTSLTPLHLACDKGHLAVVEQLMSEAQELDHGKLELPVHVVEQGKSSGKGKFKASPKRKHNSSVELAGDLFTYYFHRGAGLLRYRATEETFAPMLDLLIAAKAATVSV